VARLNELPKLDWLLLSSGPERTQRLGASAWAGVPGARLRGLELYRIELDEPATARLAGMPQLAILGLVGCPQTRARLPALAANPALRTLVVSDEEWTDPDLEALYTYKRLERVTIRAPKVTETAVKKLAAALPACRIEWDGGVIEPTKKP
jgi:hypothetical protein